MVFTKDLEDDLDHQLISYGGAPHALIVSCFIRYHEKVDKKLWQQFTEFVAGTLSKVVPTGDLFNLLPEG